VAPNPNPAPRSGTLTVAGKTLTVNQMAAACTYTVTPKEVTVPKNGGSANFMVQTSSGCPWSVQNPLNWVTVTSGNSGAGNGSVTLQIAANPMVFGRAAAVYIAGKLVVITQTNVTVTPLGTPGNIRVIP
jgi:hypothetical protein